MFFKAASHANSDAERKCAGPSPFFSSQINSKLLSTSASNNTSLQHTNHNVHAKFLFQNLYQLILRSFDLRQ